MKKQVLFFGGVIIIIGALAAVAFSMAGSNKKDSTTTSTTVKSQTPPSNETPATAPILIKYTNSGFTPVKVSVKPGTRITILNDSSSDLQLNSDPHPSHTDNPELNVGSVAKGEDKTFAVTKSGEWGYHNHLNSTEKGTIVVQ